MECDAVTRSRAGQRAILPIYLRTSTKYVYAIGILVCSPRNR